MSEGMAHVRFQSPTEALSLISNSAVTWDPVVTSRQQRLPEEPDDDKGCGAGSEAMAFLGLRVRFAGL